MFVVTFHGGSGGTQHLYSYEDDGSGGTPYLTAATPSGTTGFRDIQFLPLATGGLFYLVNSYKNASEVFQISPEATTVPAPLVNGVGGTGTVLCSVYHPFAIAFDGAMEVCYVSNQDSNTVVRVNGPNATDPGQPMAINPVLLQLGDHPTFLPGTFVASQIPLAPPGCPTPTSVGPNQGGLAASPSTLQPDQTPSNSVRGLAVIGTTLYVADEVENCIRTYDTDSGAYLGQVADTQGLVLSPTHLLANGGLLYISVSPDDANAGALVICFNPSTQTLSAVVSNPGTEGPYVAHPAGMTFDGSGNFYLADLDGQVVYQFGSDFTLTPNQPFLPQGGGTMPDQPEFILWVDDAWVTGAA
ncbi:MAG TPA: hypothetical protein VGV87_17115 [Blastocatellia bacterium]|nr:hypothetical protein [Blastocatellia bacterium]